MYDILLVVLWSSFLISGRDERCPLRLGTALSQRKLASEAPIFCNSLASHHPFQFFFSKRANRVYPIPGCLLIIVLTLWPVRLCYRAVLNFGLVSAEAPLRRNLLDHISLCSSYNLLGGKSLTLCISCAFDNILINRHRGCPLGPCCQKHFLICLSSFEAPVFVLHMNVA